MFRTISLSIPFLALMLCHRLAAQDRIDWKGDIEILESELESRHPDLFFRENADNFHNSLDRVLMDSPGKPVFDVAVQLQQSVAGLDDPNTRINYHYLVRPQMILPLRLYWFEDGLYVIRAAKEYADLLGKRIVRINAYPISVVADSLSSLVAGRNAARTINLVPGMITWVQLLNYFGFSDTTSVDLQVEGPDGRTFSATLRLPAVPGETVRLPMETLPLGFRHQRSFFYDTVFAEDKTCYIQYNQCWSREAEEKYGTGVSALFMPSIREFGKKLVKNLKTGEIERLVFDLRYNEGGDARQGTRLIRKIKRTRTGRRSTSYLLVGRKTDGAAIINAIELMDELDAVTIGETTAGKPNHFGRVERFVLPGSGLVVSCSGKYFRPVKSGDPEAIVPDICTGITFEDYVSGTDPAYAEVFRHPPKAD